MLTTEFKINLLTPARGDRLRAVGRVIRNGKKLVVALADVFAEEGATHKHVAPMIATMMAVEGADLRD